MMPSYVRDMEPHDIAGALIQSLEERGIIEVLPGTTNVDLSYHIRQWYGVPDPFKDVKPPPGVDDNGQ